jgi:plastocyanin
LEPPVTQVPLPTNSLKARSASVLGLVATAWLVSALTTGRADAAQTVPVEIRGFAFLPATLTIQAGDTVTWTNLDDTEHTATSDAGSPAAFDTGALSLNDTASITFAIPGTYQYHCNFHQGMAGTIIVEAVASSSTEPAPSSVDAAPASPGATASLLPDLADLATSGAAADAGASMVALGALLLLAALAVAGWRRSVNP